MPLPQPRIDNSVEVEAQQGTASESAIHSSVKGPTNLPSSPLAISTSSRFSSSRHDSATLSFHLPSFLFSSLSFLSHSSKDKLSQLENPHAHHDQIAKQYSVDFQSQNVAESWQIPVMEGMVAGTEGADQIVHAAAPQQYYCMSRGIKWSLLRPLQMMRLSSMLSRTAVRVRKRHPRQGLTVFHR